MGEVEINASKEMKCIFNQRFFFLLVLHTWELFHSFFPFSSSSKRSQAIGIGRGGGGAPPLTCRGEGRTLCCLPPPPPTGSDAAAAASARSLALPLSPAANRATDLAYASEGGAPT